MESSILELVAGGSVVLTVFIFIGFLKWAVTQMVDMMDRFQNVVKASMDANTENIHANTRLISENYQYLKKRNGSLERNDKMIMDSLKTITDNQKKTSETLNNIRNQKVSNQTVEHQIISRD
jgi:hypothetical protein